MRSDLSKTESVGTYTVYVGGTSTSKTNVATISASAVKYTVKFVDEDGTTVLQTNDLEEDAKITPPETNPTKASDDENDYTFAGWYDSTDANQTLVTFDDNTKVTGAVTYKAKFTAVPKTQGGETTQYDFNVNSGLTGDNLTKPYGIENGKIIRVKGLKETDVVTVTVDGTAYTAKYYKTPDNEVVHIVALVTEKTITNDMISHTTGTPELIIFGDATTDIGVVNSADSTYITRCAVGVTLRKVVFSLPNDIMKLVQWDANADGVVNSADSTLITRSAVGVTLRKVEFSLPTMGAYKVK